MPASWAALFRATARKTRRRVAQLASVLSQWQTSRDALSAGTAPASAGPSQWITWHRSPSDQAPPSTATTPTPARAARCTLEQRQAPTSAALHSPTTAARLRSSPALAAAPLHSAATASTAAAPAFLAARATARSRSATAALSPTRRWTTAAAVRCLWAPTAPLPSAPVHCLRTTPQTTTVAHCSWQRTPVLRWHQA